MLTLGFIRDLLHYSRMAREKKSALVRARSHRAQSSPPVAVAVQPLQAGSDRLLQLLILYTEDDGKRFLRQRLAAGWPVPCRRP
jgi:hypothetical protein